MLRLQAHETPATSQPLVKCVIVIALVSFLVVVAQFSPHKHYGRARISNAVEDAVISDRTADQCLPGEYYDEVIRMDCVPCLVGHYCPGGDMLLECPVGTFQNRPGQTACIKCPANQISEDLGAETCTPCPPGECAPPGSSVCSRCTTQPPGVCGVSFELFNAFGVLPGRNNFLSAAGSITRRQATWILSNKGGSVRRLPAGNVGAVVRTTFNAQPDATCGLAGVTGPGLPGSSSIAGYWVLYSRATPSHRGNCFHFYEKGDGFVVIPQIMRPRWMDYGVGVKLSATTGYLYVNTARRAFRLAGNRMVFPPHQWYFTRVGTCNIGGQVKVVPRRFL